MGWTGTYRDCPKNAHDRIQMAINQEGFEYTENNGRYSKVLASAIVGTTVYLAVEVVIEKVGFHKVYGAVVLTEYVKARGEFLTKGMDESMGPNPCDCPKRILDLLTPTDCVFALDWRKRCAEKRAEKRKDVLGKLAIGSRIRITGEGAYKGMVLEAYKRRSTKVFVDWFTNRYMTQKQVRMLGYEVV